MFNIRNKKYILFASYILFNICLIYCLFGIKNGYLYVLIFIISSQIRDILNIIYQIFNLKSLIQDYPEIKEHYKICCIIPAYDEDLNIVLNNIDSLCNQHLPKNINMYILIIFDDNKHTFNELNKKINVEKDYIYKYTSWNTLQNNKVLCYFGEYKGVPIISANKYKNSGKKDSLIVAESILEDLKIMPDFIYHTDCDTITDPNCINYLLKMINIDKQIIGVSGIVRALDHSQTIIGKLLFYMQDFQYYFSLIVRRNTESLLNSTICLPGCVNLIRVCDISKQAIKEYKELPCDGLIDTITKMQGTDRRYTSLLLQNNAKIKMEWRALAYTLPPTTIKSFINQRRRWSSNAFFNSCYLIFFVNLPLYVRLSCLVDITRLFVSIFRFVSYIYFFILLFNGFYDYLIILIVFVLCPNIYIIMWILMCGNIHQLFGLILNKLCMPILSLYIVTKMFITSTDFYWKEPPADYHTFIQIEKN